MTYFKESTPYGIIAHKLTQNEAWKLMQDWLKIHKGITFSVHGNRKLVG